DRPYMNVPQPASRLSPPSRSIPVDVPPTPVIHGSLTGKSVCTVPVLPTSSPASPEENRNPMPCAAPCSSTCSYAVMRLLPTYWLGRPHESVTMDALLSSTMRAIAFSRSQLEHDRAA